MHTHGHAIANIKGKASCKKGSPKQEKGKKNLTKGLSKTAKGNNTFEVSIGLLGRKHIGFINGIISDDTAT